MTINHGRKFFKKSDDIDYFHSRSHIFQPGLDWKKIREKGKKEEEAIALASDHLWTAIVMVVPLSGHQKWGKCKLQIWIWLFPVSLVFVSMFACSCITERWICCKIEIPNGKFPNSMVMSSCIWFPSANLNPHLTFKRIWDSISFIFFLSLEGVSLPITITAAIRALRLIGFYTARCIFHETMMHILCNKRGRLASFSSIPQIIPDGNTT